MKAWERAILHVDMDAFFAAVEQLDDPSLRGRPVIIGGSPEARGVVSTASYEARRFGAHSAMPTALAMRLCPQAVLVAPRHWRYQEVSKQVFAIFDRVTPLVQPVSLDEAFLDVTGCQILHGDPVSIARRIRLTIRQEVGLTASVGVASCRLMAKIASDLNKPDGLTVVPEEELLSRLEVLPVGKIWGVGPVTCKRLERLGIRTAGQLRQWPVEVLAKEFGAAGVSLHLLANGIDTTEVTPEEETKSISHEYTFPQDITNREELELTLLDQSDQVAARLRSRRLAGKVVCLKLRYQDFTCVTRRQSLPEATCLAVDINRQARQLLRERTEAGSRPVRLIGVGMTKLETSGTSQNRLFYDVKNQRQERLERTADHIREKLGDTAIQRASLCFRS
ncbi:MAG: DNA polymerase IV [Planctomycetota bacterium]|jgi:DNA polymerase-4|nr:DNA polymerase IV [Planctomycetota bacterium]